jgi:D-amino-acid dehydrogenase
MSDRGSVLVIGGGVIGVCSAYYLAKDGWDVTVVEKGEVSSGSSYGNAGLVVPSHSIPIAAPGVWVKGLKWMRNPESPFYIKPRLDPGLARWLWSFRAACTTERVDRAIPVLRDLNRESLRLYRQLADIEGFDFGFEDNGVLMVFRSRENFEEARREAEHLERFDIEAKILDDAGARAVEPAVAPGLVGAVHMTEDAHLIPDRFVTGLAGVAEGLGVKVLRNTEVLGLRREGRRVVAVETTRGDFEPAEVVVAAGAWSPQLVRQLGVRLPIQPAKGYSVTWRRPATAPRVPLMLGEVRASITPMGETLRVGGTLELAGMDLSINRRRVSALVRAASHYLVGADQLETLEVWRGLRPVTPDGLPALGRPAHLDNVTLAAGHAMVGMSLGPVSGKLVAQLVARETPFADISLFAPGRFG